MKKFLTVLAFVFVIAAIIAPSSAFAVVKVGTSADLTAALQKGGEIKLTANITDWGGQADITNNTTLDLAGKTLKSTGNSNADAFEIKDGAVMTVNDTVGDGKIDASAGYYAFRVVGQVVTSGTTTPIKSTLIINGGEISTQYYGVFIYGEGALLDVNGGTIKVTKPDGYAIAGNGGTTYKGATVINIKKGNILGGDGTDEKNGAAAIYHPQDGTLNISGGTLSGYNGVQFKAGTLNMTGGTITGTGDLTKDTPYDSGNGCVITGAALSLITNNAYAGKITANISGTAKLISDKSYAVFERKTTSSQTEVIEVNISNGTFDAKSSDMKALSFENWGTITKTAIIGGTYSSDPTTYVKSGYVATNKGDVYVVTSEKKPVEPVLPVSTSVEVVPVSADKVVVTSVDMTLKEASKDEAIAEATKVVAEIITDGGIAQSYLTVNETGKVVAKPELVEKAIKSVTLPKNEVLVTGTITPLPIMKADVSAGKVAAITFEVSAQDLKAKKAGDVKLFKVLSPTKGAFFKFVDTPASVDDAMFALQPSSVASNDFLSADTAIETGKSYRLTMFIKDNGKFDLDKTAGWVADPAELIETKTVTPSSGSSSGCNAGFAALALLAVVPVIYRRKK